VFNKHEELELIKIWVTEDVRPGRSTTMAECFSEKSFLRINIYRGKLYKKKVQ